MTTPKKPADRKPKEIPFNQLPGAEYLKPFTEVDALTAVRLVADLEETVVKDTGDFTTRDLAAILEAFTKGDFVADPEGFKTFFTAANLEPSINLIVAYINELKKD